MNICVFCSANENIDPEFFTMTSQLGEWIGRHGHALVYGGCDMGLMECVAKAVRKSGGKVIGVIPSRLEQGGHASKYIDERITCDTLGERKKLMLENSDAIVALPGGIGTLDEIFTVASEGTLSYHDKRVIVYNMKGFWNKLIETLDKLESDGFIRGNWHNYIAVANNFEEMCELLKL